MWSNYGTAKYSALLRKQILLLRLTMEKNVLHYHEAQLKNQSQEYILKYMLEVDICIFKYFHY